MRRRPFIGGVQAQPIKLKRIRKIELLVRIGKRKRNIVYPGDIEIQASRQEIGEVLPIGRAVVIDRVGSYSTIIAQPFFLAQLVKIDTLGKAKRAEHKKGN